MVWPIEWINDKFEYILQIALWLPFDNIINPCESFHRWHRTLSHKITGSSCFDVWQCCWWRFAPIWNIAASKPILFIFYYISSVMRSYKYCDLFVCTTTKASKTFHSLVVRVHLPDRRLAVTDDMRWCVTAHCQRSKAFPFTLRCGKLQGPRCWCTKIPRSICCCCCLACLAYVVGFEHRKLMCPFRGSKPLKFGWR